MKKVVHTLVVTGYGVNCEREMALAAQLAGSKTTFIHAKALLESPHSIHDYHLLFFPGGFSFADELGAGQALANKLQHHGLNEESKLKSILIDFVCRGGSILGICNGFQLLIKLGLLGVLDGERDPVVSLTYNDSGRFENRWAWHHVPASPCIYTRDIEKIYLPLRHGEGKLICSSSAARDALFAQNRVALQYARESGDPTQIFPENPNGSEAGIAGLCDSSGRIFGLMAHPEAYLFPENNPRWTRSHTHESQGQGLQLFINAVDCFHTALQAINSF